MKTLPAASPWIGAILLIALLASFPAAASANQPKERPAPPPVVMEILGRCPTGTAEDVERTITRPVESALDGTPGLKNIRSKSFAGVVHIRLLFAEGTDYYKAQDHVIKRLSAPNLPPDVTMLYGTELLRYTLGVPKDALGNSIYTLKDLRALPEFLLERQFRRTPGVADVFSYGGLTRRYEINTDPERMKRFGISTIAVRNAITNWCGMLGRRKNPMELALGLKSPKDAAAKLRAEEARALGDLRKIVIASINDRPIRIDDVVVGGPLPFAEAPSSQGVIVGSLPKHSQVGLTRRHRGTMQDDDSVVEGIVMLRWGADAHATRREVLALIKELNEKPGSLLPGVRVEVFPGGTSDDDRLWIDGIFPTHVKEDEVRTQVEKVRALLGESAEIEAVLSQFSDGDNGTFDSPGSFNHVEFLVALKAARDWPIPAGRTKALSRAELAEQLRARLVQKFAGALWRVALKPEERGSEPFTPAAGEHLVKIFGPGPITWVQDGPFEFDLKKILEEHKKHQEQVRNLDVVAGDVQKILAGIKGVQNARVFQDGGPPNFEFVIDKKKCHQFGIQVADVAATINHALDGNAGTMDEGYMSFDIAVCLPLDARRDPAKILELPLDVGGLPIRGDDSTPRPARVLLKDLVTMQTMQPTKSAIYREQGRRVMSVQFNICGRAAAEVLTEARQKTGHLLPQPYVDQWLDGGSLP